MNNYWKTKRSAYIFKLAAEAVLGNRGLIILFMRKLNNFQKYTNFWNLLECRSLILLAYYNSWTTVFLLCDDVDDLCGGEFYHHGIPDASATC